MKKLILVVTIAVLCILACKKKEEAPAPIEKKYEYKRTSGEVTKIEGDIFVDTGGTVFTVKGKGFDPSKRRYYHLLLDNRCNTTKSIDKVNGYTTTAYYSDSATLVNITDSTIKFQVKTKNIYTARDNPSGGSCVIKDSVGIIFAVTSKDSTNTKSIVTKFDILKNHKVKNKLFFNILSDTLYWHTKTDVSNIQITLDDIRAGVLYGDMVQVYFNDKQLNSGNTSISNLTTTLEMGQNYIGDCFFMFQKEFYNINKTIVPSNSFYTITMKESKTGLSIEEKRGKKGVYVKFVD